MATLTTAKRKKLKSSAFGIPKERKYPMPDRPHAANAKARATQQYEKGNLSKDEKEKIDAKANKILKKGKVEKEKVNAKASKILKRGKVKKEKDKVSDYVNKL